VRDGSQFQRTLRHYWRGPVRGTIVGSVAMGKRDNFTKEVRYTICLRVAGLCSNSDCRQPTTGPHTDDDRVRGMGKASHIHAAAPGGPRYNPAQTRAERKAATNGIWLCSNHAADVDVDEKRYPAELLKTWKRDAEMDALVRLESRSTSELGERLSDSTTDVLTSPRRLPDGTWLERQILDRLLSALESSEQRPVVLLGSPGSGKSALLAELGTRLHSNGWFVVGIKADRLPRDVTTARRLREHLGLDGPVVGALHAFCHHGKTVLIVDQLDALADLVDVHTERLTVLLNLINDAANLKNVRVVCSARLVDFRHDNRFHVLNAEEMQLHVLGVDQVDAALERAGVAAKSVPQKLKTVLQTPQWLSVFLRLARDDSSLPTTWQALLETVWEQKVRRPPKHAQANEDALLALSNQIAEREEFWIGRATLGGHSEAVGRLLSAGILLNANKGLRIGFAHQTFYEGARARAFLMGTSLAEYTVARDGSLFVRPTVWTTLSYLREADVSQYRRQLRTLWDGTLRPHLRLLVVEFLGHREDPDDVEAGIFIPCLRDELWNRAAFQAASGSVGWFDRLDVGYLRSAMLGPSPEVAYPVLVGGLQFKHGRVLELLNECWSGRSDVAHLLIGVLMQLNQWSEAATTLVSGALASDDKPHSALQRLVYHLRTIAPAAAIQLVAHKLRQLFSAKLANLPRSGPYPEEGTIDEQAQWLAHREPHETLEGILCSASSISGLTELARAEPGEFLDRFFPWLADLLDPVAETDGWHQRYRDDPFLHSKPRDGLSDEFADALKVAIVELATRDDARFVSLANAWQPTELLSIHFYLSHGFEKLTENRSRDVLNYLLGDPRRLSIGDHNDAQGRTVDIVRAAAKSLSASDVKQLEAAILASQPSSEGSEIPPVLRRAAGRQNRIHRIRLLRELPSKLLSARTVALLEQELRVFKQELEPQRQSHHVQPIRSPMHASQMALAKPEDVVGLFEELVDDTGFDHPRRWSAGGSVEAAREFAAMAAKSPERALEIMQQLSPGRHERPVGYAVAGLAESDFPTNQLLALVEACDARGFRSGLFRRDAARALEKRLDHDPILPTRMIELIKPWLDEIPRSSRTTPRARASGDRPPFLSGWGGGRSIPEGTYPILRSIMRALLSTSPPSPAASLRLLREHLERDEDPTVWCTLASELGFLSACDSTEATEFVDSLIDRFPEVLEQRDGVRLVANGSWWAQDGSLKRWVASIADSPWEHGRYAWGELVGMLGVGGRARSWATEDILQCIDSSNPDPALIGVANSLVHMWHLPAARSSCTQFLCRLIAHRDDAIDHAILRAVAQESIVIDDDAEAVLSAFTGAGLRAFLHRDGGRATKWVAELVHACPAAVITFCEKLLSLLESGDEAAAHSFTGPQDLVDLSVTAQRIPAYRERGLDLFERLLALGMYGASQVLADVDTGTTLEPK
jgi:hypothetical protein